MGNYQTDQAKRDRDTAESKLSAMEKRNAELELEIERLKKVLIQRDEEAHRLSVEGMSKAVEVRNLKIKLAEFENTAPNNFKR